MDCIDCRTEMDKEVLDGVLIDTCPDCEAHWLDGGELQELVGSGGANEGVLLLEARREQTRERRRKSTVKHLCPRCQKAPLTRHVLHGVALDRCPKCEGLWFDAGELEKVRDASSSGLMDQLKKMLFG